MRPARSAHAAMASRDCQFFGCTREADADASYCRDHRNGGTRTMQCKIEGCEEQANTKYDRGPFVGLCERHLEERRSAWGDEVRSRSSPALRSVPAGERTLTVRAREIVKLAQTLDRATAKLADVPAPTAAKAAFDEASRRAQVSPTADNLARVQQTIKELQRQSPRRQRLEEQHAAAGRAISLAIQELVKALRQTEARAA